MIAIVDYGLGNLRSVAGALEFLGASSVITSNPDDLQRASAVILPGVGSFRTAIENIDARGLRDPLVALAVQQRPVLGICLGMQLLADVGEEDGETRGLGLIPGRVAHFPPMGLPVPHIGFNAVEVVPRDSGLFHGLGSAADFYFVHSYRFECADEADVSSWCDYGGAFTASVQRKRVFGTQFHPEKSQTNGLRVLKNFLELARPC